MPFSIKRPSLLEKIECYGLDPKNVRTHRGLKLIRISCLRHPGMHWVLTSAVFIIDIKNLTKNVFLLQLLSHSIPDSARPGICIPRVLPLHNLNNNLHRHEDK